MQLQISDFIPNFDLSSYKQIRLIAASNSRVFLYISDMIPQFIAVKEVSIQEESNNQFIQQLLLNYRSQQNENIIQIYGINEERYRRMSGKIIIQYQICMEFMPYCLQDYINQIRTNVQTDKQHIIRFMQQIIHANAYLQQLSVIHGDLKPQNILIDDLQNPKTFKLCDFDHQVLIPKKTKQLCYYSTQQYQPPEISEAIRKGQDQLYYNPFKSQVYSLGLCIIQMIHTITLNDQINQDLCQEIEKHLGSGLAKIIFGMLNQDNLTRPDFIEVIRQLDDAQIQIKSLQAPSNILKSYQQSQGRFSYFHYGNTPDMNDPLFKDSKIVNYERDQYHSATDSQSIIQSNQTLSPMNNQLSSSNLVQLLNSSPQQSSQERWCGCPPKIFITSIIVFFVLLIFIILVLFYKVI